MLEHFSLLAEDISANFSAYNFFKQKISSQRRVFHKKFFQLPNIKQDRKEEPFLQTFKRFIKTNDILTFSFVRHPFER
jgi:hypothetical protein